MTTGMLWFDNNPTQPLDVKVQKAVDYYQQKYGKLPNLCLVHPSMITGGVNACIPVKPYRPILPGHLWLGDEYA